MSMTVTDEIVNLIKDCVYSVCKSAEYIDVMLIDDTLVVDVADTALAIMKLGFNIGGIRCFEYNTNTLAHDLNAEPNQPMMNKIIQYWNEYDVLSRSAETIASADDLRADPQYEALLSLKATEGLGWYKMPCNELYQYCLVPVFSGFPNISKPDKVGLIVKRLDYNTLLMEYHIYKKKINRDITMWFRTVDISKSMEDYEHHESR